MKGSDENACANGGDYGNGSAEEFVRGQGLDLGCNLWGSGINALVQGVGCGV